MGSRLKDVTGEKYNLLTITGNAPTRVTETGNRYKRVYTLCECGNTGESTYKDLKRGKVKSCGCLSPTKEIIPGEVYGFWTVLREGEPYRHGKNNSSRTVWVKCICGKERRRSLTTIVTGKSKSCGCKGVKTEKKIVPYIPIPKDTINEKWVPSYFDSTLLVSNKGRLFRARHSNQYLTTKRNSIRLSSKGKYFSVLLKDIVYKSFKGDYNPEEYTLLHIDENTTNNNIDNLFLARNTKYGISWIQRLLYNSSNSNKGKRKIRIRDLVQQFIKQNGKSYYFNIDFDLTMMNKLTAISIDRLDNNVGYIPGNFVLCTRFENRGRNTNSVEDMQALVELIKNS